MSEQARLRWSSAQSLAYADFGSFENAHRYCVKRKRKGSREFYVLLDGKAICEAPNLESGKSLAEQHFEGRWK